MRSEAHTEATELSEKLGLSSYQRYAKLATKLSKELFSGARG